MEVKELILKELKGIDDQVFLASILDLLEYVDEEGKYEMPEHLKSDIDASISEIEKGEYETHEDVMKSRLK